MLAHNEISYSLKVNMIYNLTNMVKEESWPTTYKVDILHLVIIFFCNKKEEARGNNQVIKIYII